MILDLYFTSRFKKDYKLMIKRGMKPSLLEETVELLRRRLSLPEKYHDHELSGDYAGFRECHILPDWLLVYRVEADRLMLTLFRTGSHSDLF